MLVDRIEWIVIPDPATAALALQTGEVDWCRMPIPDLVPLLRKNRNVMVDIADPLGAIGWLRINHLHPPFNDVRARRAIPVDARENWLSHAREDLSQASTLYQPIVGFSNVNASLDRAEEFRAQAEQLESANAKAHSNASPANDNVLSSR